MYYIITLKFTVPTNDPHHDRIPADSGADYGFDHPPPSYSSPPRYSEQLSTERESRNRHRGWRQEDDGETVVYDPYGTDGMNSIDMNIQYSILNASKQHILNIKLLWNSVARYQYRSRVDCIS